MPHSLPTEVALLGAMMLREDAVAVARSTVAADDFYRTAHRVLFEAACAVDDVGATVDVVTVLNELDARGRLDEVGGAAAVHEVVDACATPSAAPDYADTVATTAWRRRTAKAAARLQRAACDASVDLTEVAEAILETVRADRPRGSADGELRCEPLDWAALWESGADDVDWLVEDLAEAGRAAAVYAPAKSGKSLVILELAVCLATGRPFVGLPVPEPASVLYVDWEMSPGDVLARLRRFGVAPDDLDRLAYLSLPMLPPLDSAEGGRRLAALVDRHDPALVVLDSFGRAVEGPENDADTVQDFYRHTGVLLKKAGVAVWRIDHAGKDPTRGQRGSSAKADDVDVIWELTNPGRQRWRLTRKRTRTIHGVDELHVRRSESGLLVPADGPDVDDRVDQLVDHLDRLDVPADHGRKRAGDALRDDGVSATNGDVVAAQQRRRERGQQTVLQDVRSKGSADGFTDGFAPSGADSETPSVAVRDRPNGQTPPAHGGPEAAPSGESVTPLGDTPDGRPDAPTRTPKPEPVNDACEDVHDPGDTPTVACRVGRHGGCSSCSCTCHAPTDQQPDDGTGGGA